MTTTSFLLLRRWLFGEGLAGWEMLDCMMKLVDIDRWEACLTDWRKLEAASPTWTQLLAGTLLLRRKRRLRMSDYLLHSLFTFPSSLSDHPLPSTDPKARSLVNSPSLSLAWDSPEAKNLSNVLIFLVPQRVPATCSFSIHRKPIQRSESDGLRPPLLTVWDPWSNI